jgi:hypothetical protein
MRLLYSSNTFIFLQNNGLQDLQSIILPERFKLIRSVHLHWQFREVIPSPGKCPWTQDIFDWDMRLLHEEHMPQLKRVSIFVQGPLHLQQTYRSILDTLQVRIASPNRPLEMLVLRVPNGVPSSHWTFSVQEMENMIDAMSPVFSVVKPAETAAEPVDADVGADVGWRCGTLFLSMGDGASGQVFRMRRYVVWTPLPRGLTWPCRF